MEWIILFVVSHILLLLLIDWKTLKINIWNGLIAIFLQVMIDTKSIYLGNYEIKHPIIPVFGSSIFFILGPVLVVGILMAQYYPIKKWLKIVNPFILAILYTLQEILLLKAKALIYLDWDIYISLGINTLVMLSLSWFCATILDKGRSSY